MLCTYGRLRQRAEINLGVMYGGNADSLAAKLANRGYHVRARSAHQKPHTGHPKSETVEPHTIAVATRNHGGVPYRPMRQMFAIHILLEE
jgi:hypothetical protein